MPRVNAAFRTLTGPGNTAAMGSSMGGLLSFYLVTHHPEAFGACGCESTHFPLSEAVVAEVFPVFPCPPAPDTTPYIIRDIRSGLRAPRGARYRFDYGSLGLDSAYAPTHEAVRRWLLARAASRDGTSWSVATRALRTTKPPGAHGSRTRSRSCSEGGSDERSRP